MKKLAFLFFIIFTVSIIAGQIVYVTPKGKKYHSNINCRTLKKSKNIIEIDISKVGNRQPCKICF